MTSSVLVIPPSFIDHMDIFPETLAPEPKLFRSKSVIRDEEEITVVRDHLRGALAKFLERRHYTERRIAGTISHRDIAITPFTS